MLSPLQLRTLHFTDVHLAVNPEGRLDAPVKLRTFLEGGEGAENKRLMHAKLTVTIEEDREHPPAYRGSITAVGTFQVADSYDIAAHLDVMRVNAVSLVYGAIRELVMNLSSRSTAGTLCLPTLSFIDLPTRLSDEAPEEAPAGDGT